jgi:hypothetical protein
MLNRGGSSKPNWGNKLISNAVLYHSTADANSVKSLLIFSQLFFRHGFLVILQEKNGKGKERK